VLCGPDGKACDALCAPLLIAPRRGLRQDVVGGPRVLLSGAPHLLSMKPPVFVHGIVDAGIGAFNSEVVHSRLDVRPYLSARRRQAFINGLIPSEEPATVLSFDVL